MRVTLPVLLGAFALTVGRETAHAYDGAGLFALPPERVATFARSTPSAAGQPLLVRYLASLLDGSQDERPGELALAPLLRGFDGGGVVVSGWLCGTRCGSARTPATRGALDAPARRARAQPDMPPGIATADEGERAARSKVPLEETRPDRR